MNRTGAILAESEPGPAPGAVLGMLVFIASEATFFAFLLIAYIRYRNDNVQGPLPSEVLEVGRVAIFSFCLFASSATLLYARARLKRSDVRGFRTWLALTVALGAAFLIGQGLEYISLVHQHVTPARNLFGSTFFTLTGFHGLHVTAGIALLCTVLGLSFSGDVDDAENTALRSIEYYWHFVDAVWVVIFTTVYLWSLT
jgi:heme/copper-type cytochrome/quinol oxidase subunit 3